MIPTERLEEIRELAEKAGGREWFTDPRPTNSGLARIDDGTSSMFAVKAEWPQANFIAAANPQTVSSIITELLALRARTSLLNVAVEAEIRAGLEAARDLAKTMEGLTSCRSDDDYVWGAQEKIEAAFAAIQAITASSDKGGDDV